MATATVTIEFVNQPKEGKRKGSIKTKELGYIGVWPDKLTLFTKGQVCTLEYKEEGNFKDFVKIIESGPKTNGNGHQSEAAQVRDQTSERIFVCGIVNAAVGSGKVDLNGDSLLAITQAARDAWAGTFGASDSAPY